MDPAQYVPLTPMSTRPGTSPGHLAGRRVDGGVFAADPGSGHEPPLAG
jgi:hypothetical protein